MLTNIQSGLSCHDSILRGGESAIWVVRESERRVGLLWNRVNLFAKTAVDVVHGDDKFVLSEFSVLILVRNFPNLSEFGVG